jgi:hypothetical protein
VVEADPGRNACQWNRCSSHAPGHDVKIKKIELFARGKQMKKYYFASGRSHVFVHVLLNGLIFTNEAGKDHHRRGGRHADSMAAPDHFLHSL